MSNKAGIYNVNSQFIGSLPEKIKLKLRPGS